MRACASASSSSASSRIQAGSATVWSAWTQSGRGPGRQSVGRVFHAPHISRRAGLSRRSQARHHAASSPSPPGRRISVKAAIYQKPHQPLTIEDVDIIEPRRGRSARAHRVQRRVPLRPPLRRRALDAADPDGARPRGGRRRREGGRGRHATCSRATTSSCRSARSAAAATTACAASRTCATTRRSRRPPPTASTWKGEPLLQFANVGLVRRVHDHVAERRREDSERDADGRGGADRLRRDDGHRRRALHRQGARRRDRGGDRLRRHRPQRDPGLQARRREPNHRDRRGAGEARAGQEASARRRPSTARPTTRWRR